MCYAIMKAVMMSGGLAWACHREVAWEMIFIAYHACVNYCYSDAVTCLVYTLREGNQYYNTDFPPSVYISKYASA